MRPFFLITSVFLILFILTLSLLLKKHVYFTYSNNICHFYRLSLKKFIYIYIYIYISHKLLQDTSIKLIAFGIFYYTEAEITSSNFAIFHSLEKPKSHQRSKVLFFLCPSPNLGQIARPHIIPFLFSSWPVIE